jgi:hypothetical protein
MGIGHNISKLRYLTKNLYTKKECHLPVNTIKI